LSFGATALADGVEDASGFLKVGQPLVSAASTEQDFTDAQVEEADLGPLDGDHFFEAFG
jgi:hypothetical protein